MVPAPDGPSDRREPGSQDLGALLKHSTPLVVPGEPESIAETAVQLETDVMVSLGLDDQGIQLVCLLDRQFLDLFVCGVFIGQPEIAGEESTAPPADVGSDKLPGLIHRPWSFVIRKSLSQNGVLSLGQGKDPGCQSIHGLIRIPATTQQKDGCKENHSRKPASHYHKTESLELKTLYLEGAVLLDNADIFGKFRSCGVLVEACLVLPGLTDHEHIRTGSAAECVIGDASFMCEGFAS